MSFLYELNGIPVNEMKRSSFSQKINKIHLKKLSLLTSFIFNFTLASNFSMHKSLLLTRREKLCK